MIGSPSAAAVFTSIVNVSRSTDIERVSTMPTFSADSEPMSRCVTVPESSSTVYVPKYRVVTVLRAAVVRCISAGRRRRRARRSRCIRAAVAFHELRGEMTAAIIVEERNRIFAQSRVDPAIAGRRPVNATCQLPRANQRLGERVGLRSIGPM